MWKSRSVPFSWFIPNTVRSLTSTRGHNVPAHHCRIQMLDSRFFLAMPPLSSRPELSLEVKSCPPCPGLFSNPLHVTQALVSSRNFPYLPPLTNNTPDRLYGPQGRLSHLPEIWLLRSKQQRVESRSPHAQHLSVRGTSRA